MSVELSPPERIILAIDTSTEAETERLVGVAKEAGARFVKLGLELSTATSWRYCSELAAENNLDWVADAKLHDIPNTVAGAVKNIANLDHPPFGITMHTASGNKAMETAQEEAGDIVMFGVTVLTSIDAEEVRRIYKTASASGKVFELATDAATAGLKGVVCAPLEVGGIKRYAGTKDLLAMIPGTRSAGAAVQDQARVATPGSAIKNGADLLVIGRQITKADEPAEAFESLIKEIEEAENERA